MGTMLSIFLTAMLLVSTSASNLNESVLGASDDGVEIAAESNTPAEPSEPVKPNPEEPGQSKDSDEPTDVAPTPEESPDAQPPEPGTDPDEDPDDTSRFTAPDELDQPKRSNLQHARIVIWTDADEETYYGDTVTVYCDIENLYGWEYTLQWQFADESGQWTDVLSARSHEHSFIQTPDNNGYKWRVRVDIVIPDEVGEAEEA